VEGGAEQLLLDAMLALFKEQGWLKERQRQRTGCHTEFCVKVHFGKAKKLDLDWL
jgi:hypothetical protein